MADRAGEAGRIIAGARGRGSRRLDEHQAKLLLSCYGIPVTRETLVARREEAAAAAARLGYPVVMKGCSPEIPHKTERGLVRLDLRSEAEALRAFDEITAAMRGLPGGVLVQEMVPGGRELAAGLVRDPVFGPCVMFGLGGIFTEILHDVAFRKAPLSRADALRLLGDIRAGRVLEETRGLPPADREELAALLVALGRLGREQPEVEEADLNPILLAGSRPVVADALVVLR